MKRCLDLTVLSLLLLPSCSEGRPGGADEGLDGTDGIFDEGPGEDIDGDEDATGDDADDGTGTDDDGDGDDTDTDTDTGTPTCGESTFEPQAVPPNVVIVLDKSRSMISNSWDHDGDSGTPELTRWNSLHNVVEFIVGNFEDQVNFGANLFPAANASDGYNEGACRIASAPEVPVAAQNGAAILAGIPPAESTALAGATPATAGIEVAREHLTALDPNVERFMILVTDGAANCRADATQDSELFEWYDDHLPVAVADALENDGISTFVVGIDISDQLTSSAVDGTPDSINPAEKLNEVAAAGGMPRAGAEQFYNANDETELQAALEEIAGAVLSCTIPLNPAPESYQQMFVNIHVNGGELARVEDCASEDGWMWSNLPSLDQIELCGTACSDFKDNGGRLDAVYGCPPPE